MTGLRISSYAYLCLILDQMHLVPLTNCHHDSSLCLRLCNNDMYLETHRNNAELSNNLIGKGAVL